MNEAFRLRPMTYELLCECSRCECMTRIDVPGDVYDKVRVAPDRFLVAGGHEEGDRRVAGTTAYSVVVESADGARTATASG